MPTSEEPVAIVTTQKMYELLVQMDGKLTTAIAEVASGQSTLRDHETRLREIEQREDLSRRMGEVEVTLKAVQQRLWAFPSIAGLAAIVAIVIAISDKL